MTEAEWLTCPDPHRLLDVLGDRPSERKLRLFACACCRRHWHLLIDPRSRQAVEVAEKFADGEATAAEVSRASSAAFAAVEQEALRSIAATGELHSEGPLISAAWTLAWHIRRSVGRVLIGTDAVPADILRHITGNPWRPVHIDDGHPDNWHVYPEDIQALFIQGPLPATVNALADALYSGADCGFALADALLECGQDELAAHFHEIADHPKGCAWLDAILGKE